MKKFACIIAALAALVLLAALIAPSILLKAATQPSPDPDCAYAESFCTDYEQVRERIEARRLALEAEGIALESHSEPISAGEGLYIDCLYLPAAAEMKNLIILTTGVHGIEGYIGSVMLDVFFGEIYPTLGDDTGVLAVANVNPYGMKNLRRYNENNVDLNRNFILDWEAFDLAVNDKYPLVEEFLGPEGEIGNALWHELGFYGSLAKNALSVGASTVSDALLNGQYQYPQGVYYGGSGDEESTVFLKDVFARCIASPYENLVHIDIHSGYGPRYSMVIFNSVYETMTEAETKKAFGYDNVLSFDSEGFYATTGDTTDFFYRLAEAKGRDAGVFSTCFEFGTIGDSFLDSIISLKYTVDENRQHWYPTDNETSAEIVHQHYMELFYPTERNWREKTITDFKAAAFGVLADKLI